MKRLMAAAIVLLFVGTMLFSSAVADEMTYEEIWAELEGWIYEYGTDKEQILEDKKAYTEIEREHYFRDFKLYSTVIDGYEFEILYIFHNDIIMNEDGTESTKEFLEQLCISFYNDEYLQIVNKDLPQDFFAYIESLFDFQYPNAEKSIIDDENMQLFPNTYYIYHSANYLIDWENEKDEEGSEKQFNAYTIKVWTNDDQRVCGADIDIEEEN